MKVGILTINDNNNYGNRLQNYAVQQTIKKMGIDVDTIENKNVNSFKKELKRIIKKNINKIKNINISNREKEFVKFNNYIYSSKYKVINGNVNSEMVSTYDYFVTGSDQVWNPYFNRLSPIDLLGFANDSQRISFSASFGVNELPDEYIKRTRKELKKFKCISVREESGNKLVRELTDRNDIKTLVDPTMLLDADEWNNVSSKPKQMNKMEKCKYILNYFLGTLQEEWRREIEKIANDNNCKIINILDKNDPFYATGPSEFLYLEKNAFLVCTDSFHSSVFSIIYDTPFIVFDRKQKGVMSMNSRIDTLLSKFNLTNRRFDGKIDSELLSCDYTEAKKILKKEQKKSIEFLENAFDIKK